MKKHLFTLLFTASIPLLFAQETKSERFSNLDITLNNGYQRVDMQDLNAFYGDSFFVSSKTYKPLHHAFYKAPDSIIEFAISIIVVSIEV